MTTNRFITSTLLVASFFPVLAIEAEAHTPLRDVTAAAGAAARDIKAIHDALGRYEAALNASDTAGVMPLYAEDGVFMRRSAHRQSVPRPYAKPMTRCSRPSSST